MDIIGYNSIQLYIIRQNQIQLDTSLISLDFMQGFQILSEALAKHKIQFAYGIVGVPVIELGFSLQASGIKYYGFRNQQQASYTAGYVGYLTGIPGVCLCVSGPGHSNAISGVLNAWSNNWPMILISGSNDTTQTSRQAFQEVDQVYLVKPFTKYSVRVTRAEDIPYHVNKAVKLSISGRPGPVFLDLPGDILMEKINIDMSLLTLPQSMPKFIPIEEQFSKTLELLGSSSKTLVIVGKGAAYGRAQNEVRQLIEITKLPFLPTPMGKGVVPDSHRLNISAARSSALKQAELIVLIGARLNWILHFGLPPRFNKNVKVIQLDVSVEEMGHNVQSSARLVGDCKQTLEVLNKKLKSIKIANCEKWTNGLIQKSEKNKKLNEDLIAEKTVPMTYYNSCGIIKNYLPQDTILVGEGANTMDIGRTIFTHDIPRRKLDAATFGTMGIGTPALIAAKTSHPDLWAVAVMGDSAFGFSAMQCETISRYGLGAVIFIINNNGIGQGVSQLGTNPLQNYPTSLNPETKYEKIAKAFGGRGYNCETTQELKAVCQLIFKNENKNKLYIVNVRIQSDSVKKPQENAWLTRQAPKSKL